jgi:hypothetical protein
MNEFILPILLENHKISDIFSKANHALVIKKSDILERIPDAAEKTKKLADLWKKSYNVELYFEKQSNDLYTWTHMKFESDQDRTAFVLKWN